MIIDSHFGNVNLIFLIGHFHAGRKLPIEDRRLESLRLCRFKIYSLRSIRKSGWLFLFGWEFFRVRIAEINSASVKKPLLRFDHFLWFDSFSSTSFCQNCKEIFHRRTTECFLSFSFVFFFWWEQIFEILRAMNLREIADFSIWFENICAFFENNVFYLHICFH